MSSDGSDNQRCTSLFECLECGDQHTREEREAHPFRADISICPECKAKRSKVVRDYDGPVGDSEIRTDGGTSGTKQYGPTDIICPYCGDEVHVEGGETRLCEITHCNDRWIVVDLKEGKAGHTDKYATDGGQKKLTKGDRVKGEPVVGSDVQGVLHEVIHGTVIGRSPEGSEPWKGENVIYVQPDGTEEKRPVRRENVRFVGTDSSDQ